MGHLLGASCGYRKPFRGPRSGSRSLQIRPKSVRPSGHPFASFFFLEPILDQENGILVEETRKKTSKKVILR